MTTFKVHQTSIDQYQAVVVGALAGSSDDLDGKTELFNGRENIDTAGLHRSTCTVGMTALLFLHGTASAKITRPGAKAEGLKIATKENLPLQHGNYRFYIGIRLAMEQYRTPIRIENITHLLRCRRKRRTNQAQAETVASELTLQPNPRSSYNFRRGNYTSVYNAGFAFCKLEKLSVR